MLPKLMWRRPDTVRAFHSKQFNLPVDSPGITGHTAVRANDPMARCDERNGIMTDCTANKTKVQSRRRHHWQEQSRLDKNYSAECKSCSVHQ